MIMILAPAHFFLTKKSPSGGRVRISCSESELFSCLGQILVRQNLAGSGRGALFELEEEKEA